MNLFSDIEKSKVLLIGHDTRGESLKDWLINQITYSVICPNSDIKSFIRNEKLDNIISDKEFTSSVVFNTMDLKIPLDNETINYILDNIKNKKIIIVSQLYTSSQLGEMNFYGGSRPLFISDLAIVIKNNELNVIKNRHGENYVVKIDNYEDIKQKSIL
jgi:hypothetical protein